MSQCRFWDTKRGGRRKAGDCGFNSQVKTHCDWSLCTGPIRFITTDEEEGQATKKCRSDPNMGRRPREERGVAGRGQGWG